MPAECLSCPIVDGTFTELIASVARWGSGKSTLASHLTNLPSDVERDVRQWAADQGGEHPSTADDFFRSWYLVLDLRRLPQPGERHIASLKQAFALLIWNAIFGPSDDTFDKVWRSSMFVRPFNDALDVSFWLRRACTRWTW